MNDQNRQITRSSFRMMTLILDEQQSNKFHSIAKEKHICDGIILHGKRTVYSQFLNLLGVKNRKMTVSDVLIEEERAEEILDCVTERLKLNEPNHGIAYTTSVNIIGLSGSDHKGVQNNTRIAEEDNMYVKLTVIVNRGMSEEVMDIARKAGAKGGTILHGRGTGAECAAKLFGMEIEPEKELIIILLPDNLVEKVAGELFEGLRLDVPGNGILFSEPVLDVRGLYEDLERATSAE